MSANESYFENPMSTPAKTAITITAVATAIGVGLYFLTRPAAAQVVVVPASPSAADLAAAAAAAAAAQAASTTRNFTIADSTKTATVKVGDTINVTLPTTDPTVAWVPNLGSSGNISGVLFPAGNQYVANNTGMIYSFKVQSVGQAQLTFTLSGATTGAPISPLTQFQLNVIAA